MTEAYGLVVRGTDRGLDGSDIALEQQGLTAR